MRTFQYLPTFDAGGIDVTVEPLFSDRYVSGLQSGIKLRAEVARAYLGRIQTMFKAKRYDLLWIEKECLPWLPGPLEDWLRPAAVPFVIDYDDAVFHRYDFSPNPWVRRFLTGKHPAGMQQAAMVIAGNPYLANFASQAGAVRVEVVPTAIDLDRYPQPAGSDPKPKAAPTIGWIGQRSTAAFLKPLAPVLRQLVQNKQACATAVGVDTQALDLPMQFVPWTEDTEVAAISQFDIGIMPLPDEPFERGKCGYKLIQYMASGLPVVASPVGVNRQIVEHGVNGFLAETPADWMAALQALLEDPALRFRMGQAGRKLVEQRYCIQVTGPRLASLLLEASRPSPV